ncbi:MAG: K(+)-transporting ATPase subunit C [Chloroflexi bacterium]|nr:K(+)-transporting ATPase subunit C [Chloroflexota bacterium]
MKNLLPAVRMLLIFTILTGVIYPVFVTGIAQVFYPAQANGSLITVGETVVGSALIGQTVNEARYFQGRPSEINSMQADSPILTASSGSNAGATNLIFIQTVADRDAAVRATHNLAEDADVPADLLYASGSGLDPHISLRSAQLQAARIAEARGMVLTDVEALIDRFTERPQFGIFGENRVNVLLLNLALDHE